MRLDEAPESGNVEDSRGMGTKYAVGGVGGVILLILGLIFGPGVWDQVPEQRPEQSGKTVAPNDNTAAFVRKILGTTETVWEAEFQKMGKTYTPPHLDLFSDEVRTGCGVAPAAVGPFYCPADRKVYLDPTFFDELERKLGGSKAEFSQAYVIAHEVGHHVQNLLGYMSRRGSMEEHDFSVRLELQADYLAGVWAFHGQRKFHFIEPGDVESAIETANAIGDDRLQQRSGGFVHPEKFKHGTSAQRVKWFKDGLLTGDASKQKLDHFFEIRSSKDL
jgi:predicted metalloprotease